MAFLLLDSLSSFTFLFVLEFVKLCRARFLGKEKHTVTSPRWFYLVSFRGGSSVGLYNIFQCPNKTLTLKLL